MGANLRRGARSAGFLLLAWTLASTLCNPFFANRNLLFVTIGLSIAASALLTFGYER